MYIIGFVAVCLVAVANSATTVTENVFVPEHCENTAVPDDHVLFKFELEFGDKSLSKENLKSDEFALEHVVLSSDVASVVHQGLTNMCPSYVRRITITDSADADLYPILEHNSERLAGGHEVVLTLTVTHVTGPKDYAIFPALASGNASLVIDLIDEHKGINSRDENAATSLMIATQQGILPIVAALLNTRMPKVNVNLAKPTGYTALFYAVASPKPTILQALLRRGADPNVSLLQPNGRGNTPLHFACLWEKTKFVELLLEYGANPMASNNAGQNPLQLLPADAVRSTKTYIARLFSDAAKKLAESNTASGERTKYRPEL